jgi:trehalose 2-sulfotransferase
MASDETGCSVSNDRIRLGYRNCTVRRPLTLRRNSSVQRPCSYVVCAVPRTGSSLLCSLLADTGLAGRPGEYFNPQRISDQSERWGVSGFGEYLAALPRTATPNGVFGTKLLSGHLDALLERARALPTMSGLASGELMAALFPGLRYLWIRRRDKVRQAISLWRAEKTRQWMRNGPEIKVIFEGPLDLDSVAERVQRAVRREAGWADYFASAGVDPWTIDYEDLVLDVHAAVNSALAFLGVHPGRPVATGRPPVERQADKLTEEWVAQYMDAVAKGTLRGQSGLVTHIPGGLHDSAGPVAR